MKAKKTENSSEEKRKVVIGEHIPAGVLRLPKRKLMAGDRIVERKSELKGMYQNLNRGDRINEFGL